MDMSRHTFAQVVPAAGCENLAACPLVVRLRPVASGFVPRVYCSFKVYFWLAGTPAHGAFCVCKTFIEDTTGPFSPSPMVGTNLSRTLAQKHGRLRPSDNSAREWLGHSTEFPVAPFELFSDSTFVIFRPPPRPSSNTQSAPSTICLARGPQLPGALLECPEGSVGPPLPPRDRRSPSHPRALPQPHVSSSVVDDRSPKRRAHLCHNCTISVWVLCNPDSAHRRRHASSCGHRR